MRVYQAGRLPLAAATALSALVLVALTSVAGLMFVDAPGNVFRCLTPLPGVPASERACLTRLPAADSPAVANVPSGVLAVEEGFHWDVYRALARHAPGASYSMFQPVMYFWATSPALMVTVGEAGDILLLGAEEGRALREAVGEELSGLPAAEQQFDIAAGVLRYRGRFGPAPVTHVGVYQAGLEVLFIDAALLPEILSAVPAADLERAPQADVGGTR